MSLLSGDLLQYPKGNVRNNPSKPSEWVWGFYKERYKKEPVNLKVNIKPTIPVIMWRAI